MQDPFCTDPSIRRLMVFGHPAHELALYGAIQRLRPSILILTDGGSPVRESYSRSGLGRIDLLEKASYLGFQEADFYQAMLDQNIAYFETVVQDLRQEISTADPHQIFCDAVEFYNPVHDIIYVLVKAAMRGICEATIFRIPLVYQEKGSDTYCIQRVPQALTARRLALQLDAAEVASKCRARDEVYLNLRDQAGGDFMGLSAEHAAREEVEVDSPEPFNPGEDGRELRYEWRARLLRQRGEIEDVITFQEHFIPLVEHFLGRSRSLV